MPLVDYSVVPSFDRDAFSAQPGHVRRRTFLDDEGYERSQMVKWLYNDTGSAATLGRPYRILYTGAGEKPLKIQALSASPVDTPEEICVAIEAVANNSWGYYAVEGWVEALVEGTTDCTAGDYLSADTNIVAGGAFKEDTTTRTKNSFAMYMDPTDETTNGSATLRLIRLFGEHAEILA
jgi:hypothetical protein